jgi:hypothetical protein
LTIGEYGYTIRLEPSVARDGAWAAPEPHALTIGCGAPLPIGFRWIQSCEG